MIMCPRNVFGSTVGLADLKSPKVQEILPSRQEG
jgi:hypothetical protein